MTVIAVFNLFRVKRLQKLPETLPVTRDEDRLSYMHKGRPQK